MLSHKINNISEYLSHNWLLLPEKIVTTKKKSSFPQSKWNVVFNCHYWFSIMLVIIPDIGTVMDYVDLKKLLWQRKSLASQYHESYMVLSNPNTRWHIFKGVFKTLHTPIPLPCKDLQAAPLLLQRRTLLFNFHCLSSSWRWVQPSNNIIFCISSYP